MPHPGQELRIQGEAGGLLSYFYATAGEGAHPLVVVNHGSNLAPNSQPGVSKVLCDAGYSVLVPIRRGYGDSDGPSRVDDVTIPQGTRGHGEQVCSRLISESADIATAVEFGRSLEQVDEARIAVLGCSYGGITSILATARSTHVRACVAFAAAAMSWEPVPELRDVLLDAIAATETPIMFLQAENDFNLAPSEVMATRCAELGRPFEKHIFDAFGANESEAHSIWIHAPQVWTPVVLPFLAKHLN